MMSSRGVVTQMIRIFLLLLLVPSSAFAASQSVDIIVAQAGACDCGANGSPNMCPSAATAAAGSTVSVTLVCGSAGNYLSFQNWPSGTPAIINPVATGGAASGTFSMTVPLIAADRPVIWQPILTTAIDSGRVGWGATSVTAPATFTQVLGDALPASVSADPFVPAHTLTVCPSRCNFQHPQDAINSATANHWDNVLITIQVADYPYDNSGTGVIPGGSPANAIYVNGWNDTYPPHLWVKGIIGSSGTDGTVFPTFYGYSISDSNLLATAGNPMEVTVDNIEFRNFNG